MRTFDLFKAREDKRRLRQIKEAGSKRNLIIYSLCPGLEIKGLNCRKEKYFAEVSRS